MDIEKAIEKWNNDYLYFEEIKELLDALIEERKTRQDLEPKKWEPEGGEWYVTENDTIDRSIFNGDDEIRDSLLRLRGRLYSTKDQAEQALIFQRRAMRFFRWCVEQYPEVGADDLDSFRYLFNEMDNEDLMNRLGVREDSGEVEF